MKNFMYYAIQEATSGVNKNHGGPFGAVIVKDGKIIAKAHNMVIKTNDPTAHAEVTAIRKASKKLGTFDLSGCELYTTCMPCPMCLGAIKWANISKIYYGASSTDAAAIGFRDEIFYEDKDKNKTKLENLDRDSCLKPFRLWQKKSDKKMY